MRTCLIACGNSLRRDDGVAHRVLELLGPVPDSETHALLQLTPELAAEMASADTVIFIDADISADAVAVQRVDPSACARASSSLPPLTHMSTPEDIVALSTALFGFTGEAFACRIPVLDMSPGEGLTYPTNVLAAEAARAVGAIVLHRTASGHSAKHNAAVAASRSAGRFGDSPVPPRLSPDARAHHISHIRV